MKRTLLAAFLFFGLIGKILIADPSPPPPNVPPATLTQLQEKKEQLEKELADVQKQIDALSPKVEISDEKLKKLLAAGEKERLTIISTAQYQLQFVRSDESRKDVLKLIDDTKKAKGFFLSSMAKRDGPNFLEIGDIGTIGRTQCGPNAMIYKEWGFNVVQVIDDQNVLVSPFDHDSLLWFSGVDTSAMVDEKLVTFNGDLFAVTGTKQYQSVGGSKSTVLVIQKVDTDELKKRAAAFTKDPKAKP